MSASIESIDELFRITQDRLEGQRGNISVTFANRSHIYSGRDVIGNCLQEWLPEWFTYLDVDVKKTPSSQEFPDFVAKLGDHSYDFEVKAWNIKNAPAFDLANFHSFVGTTFANPRKLNAHYFVLGYETADDGFSQGFIVRKVYLKQLWELTAPTASRPIGLQVKRGAVYAMRPFPFHKNPQKSFKSKEDFIEGVRKAYEEFPNDSLGFSPVEWQLKMMTQMKADTERS